MDGTLIRNTDSVRYLCMLNNNLHKFEETERLENNKNISWIETDHLKAELIKGLDLKEVEDRFDDNIELIQNIEEVLAYLREKEIKSILITAGPIQVADIVGKKSGFDVVYGSRYEIDDQKFTGEITTHLGNYGKLDCLKEYCRENGVNPEHCVAIGDSESDIAIFEECGRSIAINYSDVMEGTASEYIITDDLFDIIAVLESWLAE